MAQNVHYFGCIGSYVKHYLRSMILPDWSTICILEGYQVKLTYFKNLKQVQEVHMN